MRKYNLPIFIPHRGCRHDCVFCNQRKITGVDTEITPNYVRNRIKEFLSTIDTENSSVEIAFFGGSFTGLEVGTQEAFLKVACEFSDQISGIRLSTRPDYINPEIIELMKKYNVTTVELGVQSSDDDVLRLNNRGHKFLDVVNASKFIKNAGITLGHQMMIGMYASTPEKDMKTVSDVIKLSPDCVRIYPVITLKDTKLEQLFKSGGYQPYSIELAAELSKNAVLEFKKAGIDVIRVGLHSSDELEEDGGVVAGPYHQAFGEIVESLIFRERIEEEIAGKKLSNSDFEFICKKNEVSKALGHKKMNTKYFYDKYNIRLKVKTD
ncbi:MAG: radical SAM protein [Clostridia bacterium]|nr:radical SAM protein [Clostridia bacterium]